MTLVPLPADDGPWLADLKRRIQGARTRAVLAANAEQIRLYHDLVCEILARRWRYLPAFITFPLSDSPMQHSSLRP